MVDLRELEWIGMFRRSSCSSEISDLWKFECPCSVCLSRHMYNFYLEAYYIHLRFETCSVGRRVGVSEVQGCANWPSGIQSIVGWSWVRYMQSLQGHGLHYRLKQTHTWWYTCCTLIQHIPSPGERYSRGRCEPNLAAQFWENYISSSRKQKAGKIGELRRKLSLESTYLAFSLTPRLSHTRTKIREKGGAQ